MRKNTYDGLTALAALRSKLDASSSLEVIHENGHTWRAHFNFQDPAKGEDIVEIKRSLHIPFPIAYERFLLHSNGALLYYDDKYGQWGFQVYGTTDLLAANSKHQKRFGEAWPPAYLAFAESRGDADLLVLDTAHSVNENDCRVIDGDSGDHPRDWTTAARSFGDWLDRLVVAQGAKYWQWY